MILLLLSAVCDLSRDPGLPRERPLAQEVRLELRTDRQNYVIGEPVKFRFTVRNISKSCVQAGIMLSPRSVFLDVGFRHDGSDERVLQLVPGDPRRRGQMVVYRMLAPNETVSEEEAFVLDWARDTFVLDKPGRYEFSARYGEPPRGGEARLESNLWGVEVEPPPDRHRDAFEAYTKELARFAEWPVHEQPTGEIVDRAFDFVERFPASPWTKPLRWMLLAKVHKRWDDATALQRERWAHLCESDPPRDVGDPPSPCPRGP